MQQFSSLSVRKWLFDSSSISLQNTCSLFMIISVIIICMDSQTSNTFYNSFLISNNNLNATHNKMQYIICLIPMIRSLHSFTLSISGWLQIWIAKITFNQTISSLTFTLFGWYRVTLISHENQFDDKWSKFVSTWAWPFRVNGINCVQTTTQKKIIQK